MVTRRVSEELLKLTRRVSEEQFYTDAAVQEPLSSTGRPKGAWHLSKIGNFQRLVTLG
jgi:hypothetical protein